MRHLTVTAAAVTLFTLEIHTAQRLLPALGGGALVWLSTMVGFQLTLLAGYATTVFMPSNRGAAWLGALALALGAGLGLEGQAPGAGTINAFDVAAAFGLGTFLMAFGISTVLPRALWPSSDSEGSRARLIAASNVGAALGLLLGLVAVSRFGLGDSALMIRMLAALLALLSLASLRRPIAASSLRYWPRMILVASSALGVIWYLSLHARAETVIAASPQLWAVSLGLYLLSFALPFVGGRGAAWRGVRVVAFLIALGSLVWFERGSGAANAVFAMIALTAGCMAAHATLRGGFDEERPWHHGALDTALGGGLGGLVTMILLPITLTTAQQTAVAIFGLMALGIITARSRRERWLESAAAGLGIVAALFIVFGDGGPGRHILTARSWYGEFSVQEFDRESAQQRHLVLYHQGTVHGAQYLHPEFIDLPAAYFSIFGGAGIAFRALESARPGPKRVGAVGLGTGAIAHYVDRGDSLRFFEIDARNVALSRPQRGEPVFRYLEDAAGAIEVRIGDGRRLLQLEDDRRAPRYDVLVLDAFSGGSVPTHLLTREAFELYGRRTRREGWILVHTSNHSLDLRPVVYAGAEAIGGRAVFVRNRARGAREAEVERSHLVMQADWIVIGWEDSPWGEFESISGGLIRNEALTVQSADEVRFDGIAPWTDDRRSVWDLRQSRVSGRERLVGGP